MLIYLQTVEAPEERSKFETIYWMYRDTMYAVAYDILKNEQDAEDAVHQAFLKIIENISKISDPKCLKLRSYIVTIVESKAIDIYRRKKRHPESPYNEETVGLTVDPASGSTLAGCILKLPPRQRQVIILKYHHGYDLREIAKMLGISYANARAIDQRAKKQLKLLCEEAGIL